MLSGVAFLPRIARAGSPGSAWVAANTSRDTASSVAMPSRRRRRMKPGMPWSTGMVSRRRARRRPGAPRSLSEPDRPVAVAEAVQVERALVGPEALHLRRVGVEQVVEERDDVAAHVVLHLLHLADRHLAILEIHLAERLLVERDELRVLPVRLVVRRRRKAARGDLREVQAGAPEVARERPLEVLGAVEGVAV